MNVTCLDRTAQQPAPLRILKQVKMLMLFAPFVLASEAQPPRERDGAVGDVGRDPKPSRNLVTSPQHGRQIRLGHPEIRAPGQTGKRQQVEGEDD